MDFRQIDVTYHYRFDMPGYQSMEVNQDWHLEGTQVFEWTMRPGTAPVVGSAPPASTSEAAILAFNAGVTAAKAKDYATAEEKFKEAAAHDPKLRQAWAELSWVQVELGHNKEAAEAAEKAIALGATDESVMLSRWQAYHNLKDDVKAAEALKDLQKIGRQTEEAKKIHNEGAALLKAGDYAGAAAKFQEALNVDPNLQPSLLGLATADLKLGRNADAATAAETILKADPKNEQAIRIRYNACLALGDKTRLIDALVGLAAVEPVMATRRPLAIGVRRLRRQRHGPSQGEVRQGPGDRSELRAGLLLPGSHRRESGGHRGGKEPHRAFPAARAERSRRPNPPARCSST